MTLDLKFAIDEIDLRGVFQVADEAGWHGTIERRDDGLYAITPEGRESGPVKTVAAALRRLAKLPRPVIAGGVDCQEWVDRTSPLLGIVAVRAAKVPQGTTMAYQALGNKALSAAGLAIVDGSERTIYIVERDGLTPACVVETILHELVHVSGLWRHDNEFKRRLIDVTQRAFPEVTIDPVKRCPMHVLDEQLTGRIAVALRLRGQTSLLDCLHDRVLGVAARIVWQLNAD